MIRGSLHLWRLAMMPEYIILTSAVVCVASVVALYFNRDNVAVTAVAIISFIALLYGIGQRVERDKVEVKSQRVVDAADRETPRSSRPKDRNNLRPQAKAATRQKSRRSRWRSSGKPKSFPRARPSARKRRRQVS
jgi:hypothetical protein